MGESGARGYAGGGVCRVRRAAVLLSAALIQLASQRASFLGPLESFRRKELRKGSCVDVGDLLASGLGLRRAVKEGR